MKELKNKEPQSKLNEFTEAVTALAIIGLLIAFVAIVITEILV